MTWYPSPEREPGEKHPMRTLTATEKWWQEWSSKFNSDCGPWRDLTLRSLITLKALTFRPTGAIVAAPTTSLPEWIGGERNWDYRFCWLRDATFTLYALLISGYTDEAQQWREWLLRAIAGRPEELQIMYGLGGERRLVELEAPWLKGYQDSRPVRLGNAAHEQFQLDVYGEVLDTAHLGRRFKMKEIDDGWRVQCALVDYLESAWNKPDEGIWEVRGGRRHFTHSKVMAWVAVDRMVKAVEKFNCDGDAVRWRALRDRIHRDVCEKGFDSERNAFMQSYGSKDLDASVLLIPMVGFLPAKDPRMVSTIEAIQRELMVDGLVMRYQTHNTVVDGLPPGEGAFLPCSFWLADNLAMLGRKREARELLEKLTSLCNDVGLYSEEYDPVARRMLGNFPQAFTHVSLVNTVHNLTTREGPARHRAR